MNVTGIIVEYNPFHNGHLYHIEKSKYLTKADAIVAVMSGNFTQRGIPAIIDKWKRTEMALLNGVDLILELPVIYSVSSAEFFSFGAVSLLHNSNSIDNIVFGSEAGDIDLLLKLSEILFHEPKEFKNNLKKNLNSGTSFPAARASALIDYLLIHEHYSGNKEVLSSAITSSNNILGLEYCKSLIRLNSNIKPYTIKRLGSGYNDLEISHNFSSATSLRRLIKEEKNLDKGKSSIPPSLFQFYKALFENNYPFVDEEALFEFVKYKYIFSKSSLKNIPDVKEGIENRIGNLLLNSSSFKEFLINANTKRYTSTRILRILCQSFLGFDSIDTELLRKDPCPYIKVLGFNSKGKEILKTMKKNSCIPIYTKLPKKNLNPYMQLDVDSTKYYSLLNNFIHPYSDYLVGPIIK